jgi:hypothetical protein
LIGSACIFGTFAHAIAILTDRNMDARAAAAALLVAGLAIIAGRVTTGYALDKVRGPASDSRKGRTFHRPGYGPASPVLVC